MQIHCYIIKKSSDGSYYSKYREMSGYMWWKGDVELATKFRWRWWTWLVAWKTKESVCIVKI